MNPAIKISLLASGLFLLVGMLIGIVKFQRMLNSDDHMAPAYIDIAHRAAFLYSFAMLVIAKLLEYSPYSVNVHGMRNKTDNLFRERNFSTTWYVYMLTVGEISGLSVIIWGFISTQFLGTK